MAAELSALSRTGVRVYVVPGNHDILNPHAVRYERVGEDACAERDSGGVRAKSTRNAGYGEALFRDPASLSYVAEPVPGLWLLAVDSASYADNPRRTAPETGSGLTQSRVAWIESMLGRAIEMQKAVIVMLHHGVVEHFRRPVEVLRPLPSGRLAGRIRHAGSVRRERRLYRPFPCPGRRHAAHRRGPRHLRRRDRIPGDVPGSCAYCDNRRPHPEHGDRVLLHQGPSLVHCTRRGFLGVLADVRPRRDDENSVADLEIIRHRR